MIKDIPVNPYLPLKRCWDMVARANTMEKVYIADEWLGANKVITKKEYEMLIDALARQVEDIEYATTK